MDIITILTIIGIVLVVLGFIGGGISKIATLETKLDMAISYLEALRIGQHLQDDRINAIEHRVQKLEDVK